MTKIILNLREGLLEVEGEESFVKSVYEDFKKFNFDDMKSSDLKDYSGKKSQKNLPKKRVKVSSGEKKTKGKGAVKNTKPTIVKDLDLSAKGNKKDLKKFFEEKGPKNNMEMNVVFVYFLKKEAKISDVTIDHVYTCYKYVNKKVPGALRQSLLDTASRKGWIDTGSMDSIDIPVAGENCVEYDLSKKKED